MAALLSNDLLSCRQERRRKPDKPEDFVTYEDSESEEETPAQENEILNTSYNFVDYVRSRESGLREVRSISRAYASRHILTHDMFKETPISMGNLNKVFCSQWLSNKQVMFGTKCNKLLVYDVHSRKLETVPTLTNGPPTTYHNQADSQHGIHSIVINPSRSLLATGAKNSAEIALFKLPTLEPAFIGTNGHRDWVYDLCWLDDQFLVSGSKDTKLALWRIEDADLDPADDEEEETAEELAEAGPSTSTASPVTVSAAAAAATTTTTTAAEAEAKVALPKYPTINPISVKECRTAQKIRSICFNQEYKEIAVLSLNSYIHLFNAETFAQKLSRKLPNCQDNVCIACQPEGLYAVGCRSYTLLLDPRTLQPVKKIASRYSGCGIRSASFQGNILTVGTGLGMLMFYDIRAGKYLESSINSSRTVVLKASKGFVVCFNISIQFKTSLFR